MLINSLIKNKWHHMNKKHYESLGYKFTKFKDEFEIEAKDLLPNSNILVKYKCDSCENIYNIKYQKYLYKRNNNNNKDYCGKCRYKKDKKICENGHYYIEKCKECEKIIYNENSLENKFPNLVKEWNYNKNKKEPNNYLYSSNKKVWWVCKHGHEWFASIGNRTRKVGSGCPYCSDKSKGEKKIRKFLEDNKINYIKEYSFKNLLSENGNELRFDFAIFKNNELLFLIEFDGVQHFKPYFGEDIFKKQQYRDILKNVYCYKNNILLIRINYMQYEDIEAILYNYIETV